MESSVGIGDYLIERIVAQDVRHIFGVPGDYVLGFFKKLADSPLQVVNTCDEQGAGFAADAYARLNGLGVVVVTYGVGGLKIANTTAEAFAEKAPVLVISGAPGVREMVQNPLLHHKVNRFDTQMKVFEQLTVASAELSDAQTALREIDRVIAAVMRHKRPGYIELPRDMVAVTALRPVRPVQDEAQSSPDTLKEAVQEAMARINAARQPVILAGEEIHRLGLKEQVIQFAEKANIPLVVSLLGKSVVSETHPLYLGVYAGALGDEALRDYVESADCLIQLGVLLTDINLGVYTAHLDPSKSIHVVDEQVTIGYHYYPEVIARDFLQGMIDDAPRRHEHDQLPHLPVPDILDTLGGPEKVTIARLFQYIDAFLDCNTAVVADVGDALFGAIDLMTCEAAQFLSPAYYTSLGFAVPASLAVQLNRSYVRPLVLVGDGAFQMTGMELSTAVRFGLNPIVVVLNNAGYGTERPMQDGPFNDVLPWNYSQLPEVLGHGIGFLVQTEDDLHQALIAAREYTESFVILDVQLAPDDVSPALRRLAEGLKKKI